MAKKRCTKCTESKAVEAFGRAKEREHGNYWCKDCDAEESRMWRQRRRNRRLNSSMHLAEFDPK